MIRASSGSLVLFLVSLAACQPPASEESAMPESETAEMAEPAGLSEEDRAAIEETTQAWVEAAGANDFEALAATYTEDALLMPPNHEAVQGRAAIQEFFGTFPPITDVELAPVEIDGAGDIAFVRGTYTITMTPEGAEPISDSGKYIEIRERQADGSWLLSHDQWNSNLPPPE